MELLGISLNNIGLKEALRKSEEYLDQGGLNTIAYVSAKKLLEASEDGEQQKWWQKMDLSIFEDVEILKAAGGVSQSRAKEIEENAFLREFLKILVRRQAPVFLLAEEEEALEQLEEELRLMQNNLYIAGRDTTDHYLENKEGLINAINALAPRVILSRLPYPEGIHLMYDYHSYLNGSVWLTLPHTLVKAEKEGWKGKVSGLIYQKLLHKKIHQFVQEQEQK
ncbi:MAG: WecB/TagA/CpsF family glycosyltransferase [Lachnospiraceae bacterium]|nr:WecB/TagA/CpsF family glycosyltransferase [Lachnospiraceae bacterium]